MISAVLGVYARMLEHYEKKWKADRIDRRYRNWEEDQHLREEMGFTKEDFRRIPKRKIRNKAARKKHGY